MEVEKENQICGTKYTENERERWETDTMVMCKMYCHWTTLSSYQSRSLTTKHLKATTASAYQNPILHIYLITSDTRCIWSHEFCTIIWTKTTMRSIVHLQHHAPLILALLMQTHLYPFLSRILMCMMHAVSSQMV